MKIVFAGGGSGGTIGPGIAVAERLADLDATAEVVFLCSNRSIDQTMLEGCRWVNHPTPAAPPVRSLAGGLKFVRGYRATRRLAREVLDPSTHVVALGGFVAPPVVAEAKRCGATITLLNLDSRAGKANRWVARRATTCLTAVASDLGGTEGPFGVPLRRAVLASKPRDALRKHFGIERDRRVLLVTGASQGAQSLNEFMVAFLTASAEALHSWHVLHLCGTSDAAERLNYAYEHASVPATVVPFLPAMGDAWGVADLALSRGGASSVAELHANGVPSIIAPYPWHADNHQASNAQPLVAMGGAVLVEDRIDGRANLASIGVTLERLLRLDAARTSMRDALHGSPPPDAAEAIAKRLLELS